MDSGRDTYVYSAKKTYNRLIGKLDYSGNTHTHVLILQYNPHMLIALLLLPLQHLPSPVPLLSLPRVYVGLPELGTHISH